MLSPYRVLDLTDEHGLLCGQILADLGADVVRIEPPGGSSARRVGPFAGDAGDDAWVAIAVAGDAQWRGLCKAIDQPALAGDARFTTAAAWHEPADTLDALLATWTASRPAEESAAALRARGVAAAAVRAADAHGVRENGQKVRFLGLRIPESTYFAGPRSGARIALHRERRSSSASLPGIRGVQNVSL